ncbi:pyruvate oxidase [Elusimicrobium posterum]|uniref:pyruvate oxidase n=1 Tax=Elusimicrobium posterum TaxID=3116653 RepID=UPI003C7929A6
MKTMKSGTAMLKVLESWGVNHIYGIPGGSINSTMNALYDGRSSIQYIQVRHEEVGAMAAAADAKLTGKIGVCFGSAGPGATHLFNGLYDAQMDHVPVLAIIGQVASGAMNTNAFQELNENPMFTDVSVYNRTVMNPESLPKVIDEAIRIAYQKKGVSVVTIPVDYGYVDIPEDDYASAHNYRVGYPRPDLADIKAAVKLISEAKKPVLYIGQGTKGAAQEVIELSEHFSLPIVMSVLAKGILPDNTPNLMGSAGRLSTKPANEALPMADLIIFTGSDFPFAKFFFPKDAKFIQIDIDSSKFGKRHKVDVAILGDAKDAMKMMVENGAKIPPTKWLEANKQNRQNWLNWMKSFEDSDEQPLRPEPVFKEINKIAQPNAIFMTDVGNCTIFAARFLNMNGKGQQFTTSGLFATMGYGVPGGIAAQLSYPKRQVFTLNGDGAFAMVMQDVLTQVKYKLPVINIVFSNASLGFIDAEQEDTKQPKYGVDLLDMDFAKAGEAMGAKGYKVTTRQELIKTFEEVKETKVPVVIDIKIANARPFPSEKMEMDPDKFSKEDIEKFNKRYEVKNMPLLKELLK